MKKRFIKYITTTSLTLFIILLPWKMIWSCGPGLSPDEDRFALFRQSLVHDNQWGDFAYAEYPFYISQHNPDTTDWKKNCFEWMKFAGASIAFDDVHNINYRTSPDSFLSAYNSRKWKAFEKNSFVQWLLQKENYAALDYMVLAKKTEATQLIDADPWDTATSVNLQYMHSLALKATTETEINKSIFLKERYAFQAIKMNYYSGINSTRDRSFQLYNKYLQNSSSVLSGWVLAYISKMEMDQLKRTRYLLQAFDRTEEKKGFAYIMLNKEGLKNLAGKTTDKHEEALVNVLLALKNNGRALPGIQKVYAAEPGSKYLPLLIAREINKLEHWLWSPKWLSFHSSNDMYEQSASKQNATEISDENYLISFSNYLEKIATGNVAHQSFSLLAQVHLYNMRGQYVKAANLLSLIKITHDKETETQKLIEEFIVAINTKNVQDISTQSVIAGMLNRIKTLQPSVASYTNEMTEGYNKWDYAEQDDDLSELLLLLSKKFQEKADIVSAGLLYQKANVTKNNYDGWGDDEAGYANIAFFDRHAAPGDMDKLIAFKHKPNKTSFEKMIVPKKWGTDDHYKDLKGTIFFRMRKNREALNVFKSINPNYWINNYEFKDYLSTFSITHTGNLIPSEKSKQKKYAIVSKTRVVEEIVAAEDALLKANSDEVKAQLCFKLGNAFYNTSYWGTSWMMFSYGHSTSELYKYENTAWKWASFTFQPNAHKYAGIYYKLQDAQEMYKQALTLSHNSELKANILIMLATCSMYEEYFSDVLKDYRTRPSAVNSKYLAIVLKDFSNTVAFRQAAAHCTDVKQYVKAHKQY